MLHPIDLQMALATSLISMSEVSVGVWACLRKLIFFKRDSTGFADKRLHNPCMHIRGTFLSPFVQLKLSW